MKKILVMPIVLVAVAALLLILEGPQLREITTEIEIGASPTEVWAVVADVEHWPEWSPIIHTVKGQAGQGAELQVTMRDKNGEAANSYSPIVIAFEPAEGFRWRGKMMADFLFTNEKVFSLVATPSGTRLIHIEAFSGLLVPLFWGTMETQVPGMLDAMNAALKKRVESQGRFAEPV